MNHTGAPPARTEEEARLLCGLRPDAPLVLDTAGRGADGGPPSTVLDLTGDAPRAIRWGAIGPSALYALAGLELEEG